MPIFEFAMKIRISGNSVRFRLSQKEVDQIGSGQEVREVTSFATSDFSYVLGIHDEEDLIKSDFENGRLSVSINRQHAASWANSDQVGIDNDQHDKLFVLVEKDFQCLTVRANEDESDLFPNPNTAC